MPTRNPLGNQFKVVVPTHILEAAQTNQLFDILTSDGLKQDGNNEHYTQG